MDKKPSHSFFIPLTAIYVEIFVAIVLSLTAFFVIRHWTRSLAENAVTVPVVVATADLAFPHIIEPGDVHLVERRKDFVPNNIFTLEDQVVGQSILHSISKNQIFTIHDVVNASSAQLTGIKIPVSSKGFLLSQSWTAGPIPYVSVGDTITILAVSAQSPTTYGGVLVSRISVLETVQGRDGEITEILLGVDEQQSLALLRAHSGGALLQVVVDGRAPAAGYSR